MKRIFLAFLLLSTVSFSQDDLPNFIDNSYEPVGEIIPKHTFNVVLGLPNSVINKPFASVMRGIVDVNPYYQYSLPNSIVFGIGLRYTHFSVNQFKVTEPMTGVLHNFGGFIKVGYEKFYSTRFAMDFSMKVGYSENFLKTTLNDKNRGGAYRFDAGFVEPTIGLILSATENSSYRFTIGYTFQGYVFKPYDLGTKMSGGWEAVEYNKASQFITFGLGYTYYFGNNDN